MICWTDYNILLCYNFKIYYLAISLYQLISPDDIKRMFLLLCNILYYFKVFNSSYKLFIFYFYVIWRFLFLLFFNVTSRLLISCITCFLCCSPREFDKVTLTYYGLFLFLFISIPAPILYCLYLSKYHLTFSYRCFQHIMFLHSNSFIHITHYLFIYCYNG